MDFLGMRQVVFAVVGSIDSVNEAIDSESIEIRINYINKNVKIKVRSI